MQEKKKQFGDVSNYQRNEIKKQGNPSGKTRRVDNSDTFAVKIELFIFTVSFSDLPCTKLRLNLALKTCCDIFEHETLAKKKTFTSSCSNS